MADNVRAQLLKRQLKARQAAVKPEPTFWERIGYGDDVWDRRRDNILGDDDPTTQNFGEKVGTLINKAGENITAGIIGEEASAAVESILPGVTYEGRRDHYRQQEDLIDETNPALALTADIGGALLMPFGAVKGATTSVKALKSGGIGAGVAGTYGFTEGEGGILPRLQDAGLSVPLGFAGGYAAPHIAKIGGRVVDGVKHRVAQNRAGKVAIRGAPTTEELAQQGRAAYDAVDDLGVQIRPEAFSRATDNIRGNLRANTGFDELPGPGSLTPKSARAMQIMDDASDVMANNPSNPALPFKSVDQMRRQAGAAAGNVTEKSDQKAGMEIIKGLDDFIENLSPDDAIAGDVKALPGAIKKARETWQIMSKSQKIDDAMEAAENYRWGFSNGIRWQFKKILNSDKLRRGFNAAEIKAMQKVVKGTLPQKVLDLMGSGLTQIGGIAGGVVTGNPVAGLALTGASMASRAGANALARKNTEAARALIASGKAGILPPLQLPGYSPQLERLTRQGTGVLSPQLSVGR